MATVYAALLAWLAPMSWTLNTSATYQESQARLYLQYARISFCTPSAIESWNCGDMCDEASAVSGSPRVFNSSVNGFPNVQGYVAKLPTAQDTCIVSFRGSVNVMNYVRDAEYFREPWPSWAGADGSLCPDCKVHKGAAKCYDELRKAMFDHIHDLHCKNVVLAGHSLGGTIVSLASMDLRMSGMKVDAVYTYGKLRVGNSAYAAAYIKAAQRQGVEPPMWRIVNHRDPIPRLPASWIGPYVHEPLEVYYPTEKPGTFIICESTANAENTTCSWRIGLSGCLANAQYDHNTYLGLSLINTDLPAVCVGPKASMSENVKSASSRDQFVVVV